MIELKHVEKAFPGVTPLKDVNAVINKGDAIAVIGPSGTGKSTLLRCINFLDPATNGSIYMDGEELIKKGYDLPEACKKMGMVFQSFNLFNHLTVLENIMIPQMKILNRSAQEAYDTAIELLNKVGLASKVMNYPEELSGGQKQRIAIARTLAMNPEIILFDEPTSALDPSKRDEVEQVIAELAEEGTTLMIVTHDMEFARRISNRVFYMDEGIIYEDGTSEQIFNNPQKQKTKDFIFRMTNFKYEIHEKQYDFHELASEIKNYGEKHYFSKNKIKSIIAVCDEIVRIQLTPLMNGNNNLNNIQVFIEHSDKTNLTTMTISYNGSKYDPHESENEISLKLIEHYSHGFEYEYQSEKDLANVITIRTFE